MSEGPVDMACIDGHQDLVNRDNGHRAKMLGVTDALLVYYYW